MKYEPLSSKIWRVVYSVLMHIVIYALVLLGASFLFSAQGFNSIQTNELMNQHAEFMTGIALIITIPILYYFYRKDYPVRSNEFFKKPVNILLVIALALAASHGLSLLLSLFATGRVAEGYETVENAVYASAPVFVIIRGVILAPVCEELLFRGLMFRRLKDYTNFAAAAIISSAVFAVYHLNLIQGVFAFLLGLILCCIYDRFRNLWASIILHASGNLLSVILTYAGAQYSLMPVYYIVMVVMILLAAGILYYIMRKSRAGQ